MRNVLLLVLALLLVPAPAFSQASGGGAGGGAGSGGESGGGLTCPDSGAITRGGFITDLNWGGFFPIQLGANLGSSRNRPGDAAGPVCTCPGRFGFPTPGLTFGMWQPTHMLESTRQAFCFPSLGPLGKAGSAIGGAMSSLRQGGTSADPQKGSYKHFHLIAFPVGAVLDMFTSAVCSPGGAGFDLDLLFISEIDPTFANDELAVFVNPESILFANPIAQAACLADAAVTNVGRPIRQLFWCAGSWGPLYPLTGHTSSQASVVREASLSAVRGVAKLHRFGIMKRTYGAGAVCRNRPAFMYPKQQYRFQIMYPLPQRSTGPEWTGRNTLLGREFRHIPGVGEDWVQVLWTYEQCCVNF